MTLKGTLGYMHLRDYLAEHDLSRDEFARRVGAGSALTVGKWIRGERFPRLAMIRRIEKATDGAVTANDFLTKPEPIGRPRRTAA